MALSSTGIVGDRYLNYFLNALAELPAVALCVWMLQRWVLFGKSLLPFSCKDGFVIILGRTIDFI
jgi:hypothetical protein